MSSTLSAHQQLNDVKNRTKHKQQQRKSTGAGNWRRWKITLPDGGSGLYHPMFDGDGNIIYGTATAHRNRVNRFDSACTCEIEGYHGLCVSCHYEAKEEESGLPFDAREFGLRTVEYTFIGVWDYNLYVPVKYNGQDGKEKERYDIWIPPRPNAPAPAGAVLGGRRHFQLSPNQAVVFNEYSRDLSFICRCVEQTEDPSMSACFYLKAVCPRCGCLLYSRKKLEQFGDLPTINKEVFDKAHLCRDQSKNGCWTDEDRAQKNVIFPVPVWECLNHEKHPDACPGPRPLSPFDGPFRSKRTGQNKDTKYSFDRPATSWKAWLNTPIPEEAKKAFQKGMNFVQCLSILSLEQQAERLGAPYPFPPETKGYKYGKAGSAAGTASKPAQTGRPTVDDDDEEDEDENEVSEAGETVEETGTETTTEE